MTHYLAVDPGKTGALTLFEHSQPVQIIDMPDTTAELQRVLIDMPAVEFAVLEKPYIGTVAGRRQIATTYQKYGALMASMQWRDIPVREVAPADWKKKLGLGKDKSASREMASQMFPQYADCFARVKDDGRAESVLLGAYGIQKWGRS